MTKPLDEAIEAVRRLPPAAQDAIAKLLRDLVDDNDEPAEIPAEHQAAVIEGEAQVARGQFATDEQVAAAFRRFEP